MEFETNDTLVRWMEDEGLSPFTLLKLSPKPAAKAKKPPASVVMEWGLEDLEHEGDRDKFLAWRVTAEDIEVFRSEGKLDPSEECHTELGEAAGIDLCLEAGGTLVLRCARLVVSDEPVERFRKGKPRPHHGEFILELELGTTTWAKLRGWLGVPRELSSLQHLKMVPLDDNVRPSDVSFVTVDDDSGHTHVFFGLHGNRLTVSRGKWASDALWNTIWSKSRSVPGVIRICSRDLVTTPDAWPESPPRKPAPQVWPNVFGVTCDFSALTLDDLRECLRLPLKSPFVFNDEEDAPKQHPKLTLGEAARHGGGDDAIGIFHDASERPLVYCRADLREGVLSFRRERGCSDATWFGVWTAPERLPGVTERHSRTTQSPPDPWPAEPPAKPR